MVKERKFISGLRAGNILISPYVQTFTTTEKHKIVQEYLSSGKTKREIWEKYTGQKEEHGSLLRWMRALGYQFDDKGKSFNFTSVNKNKSMSKDSQSREDKEAEFELLQLKERISELEHQLKAAEMKAIAFSTMVDIAENEFNIPIRKKYNTKPSKK